jgi:hypothetical protein
MLFLLFLPLLDSWWRVELIAMCQGTGQKSVVAPLPFVSWPWIRDYRMRFILSRVACAAAGGAQFEIWPGHRLSQPKLFVVSLSRSWQMLGKCLKPGHHSFPPYSCLFSMLPKLHTHTKRAVILQFCVKQSVRISLCFKLKYECIISFVEK